MLRELLSRIFIRKYNREIDVSGSSQVICIRNHGTKDVAILIIWKFHRLPVAITHEKPQNYAFILQPVGNWKVSAQHAPSCPGFCANLCQTQAYLAHAHSAHLGISAGVFSIIGEAAPFQSITSAAGPYSTVKFCKKKSKSLTAGASMEAAVSSRTR